MRRFAIATLIAASLAGCSTMNLLTSGANDECRWNMRTIPDLLASEVNDEFHHEEVKNGHYGQPYTWQMWNENWNQRLFYLADLGPASCQGTYRGPSGPDMLRATFIRRRELGLPEVELEERNKDKAHLLR